MGMSAPTTPHIFVSYNRQDVAFTRRLVASLEGAGAVVWVDWEGARDGDFLKRINQGLVRCDWLVLVETPTSLTSDPVEMEVNAALNRALYGQMRGVVRLIASARDPRSVPPTWATLQYYDATSDYDTAVAAMLDAIRAGDQRQARRPGAEHPGGSHIVAPPSPATLATPSTPGARLLSRMANAAGEGDWQTVVDLADLLLAEYPNEVTTDFYRLQGRALLELARPAEAATALRLAYERDTLDIPTMRAAARAALQANDLASAEPLLKRAVTLAEDPDERLDILREYVPTLQALGRQDEAFSRVEQALRLRPDDPAWLTLRRDLLSALGRDAEALVVARTLTARPSEASASDWLALARLARTNGALDDAKRALLHAESLSADGERLAPEIRAELFPPPDVPQRLASLGFRGVNIAGAQAILPPLVSVAAGPFLMGSDKARDREAYDSEQPQHRVELAAFQIGMYPVTVAEYALAVRAGAAPEPPPSGSVTWQTQLQHPDHPVVCVSWQDANAYIAWLREVTSQPGWRLPSEAQWEKAARWDAAQGVSRIYPWGDSFDKQRCNTVESGIKTTTPVGSYPANDRQRSGASPCGAEDMAGNVWEWTNSVYKPYPYTESDGRKAHDSTENRTLRGGSWGLVARFARAAYRGGNLPVGADDYFGFRLVLASLTHSTNAVF